MVRWQRPGRGAVRFRVEGVCAHHDACDEGGPGGRGQGSGAKQAASGVEIKRRQDHADHHDDAADAGLREVQLVHEQEDADQQHA